MADDDANAREDVHEGELEPAVPEIPDDEIAAAIVEKFAGARFVRSHTQPVVYVDRAVFADVGSLWDYKGPTSWSVTGETLSPADTATPRASVGVGLIWNSPFGPLRFDYAVPLMKQDYDRVQQFRFGGGTRF